MSSNGGWKLGVDTGDSSVSSRSLAAAASVKDSSCVLETFSHRLAARSWLITTSSGVTSNPRPDVLRKSGSSLQKNSWPL